jgi:predicted PurR-regulated permease PerM
LIAIFLAILGIHYFLPLAIMSALASLVPMVGAAIAGVVVAVVALLEGGIWKALAVVIYVIIYQQIENHVLGPLVFRKTVSLNPLISVLALAILGHIGGLAWAILSVPVIATGQIIVRELLQMRRERLNLGSP